jgi:transcriptional regulator with XRE-family HTH domain
MEKKKRAPKESKISFDSIAKESLAPRLLALMNGRTIREVSKDWGISASNLNNYLYRGSIPRTNVLQRIANAECITIDELFEPIDNIELNEIPDTASNVELPPTQNNEEHRGSIATNEIKQRVLSLIGDRSRRAAAKAWGMNISTLTNFLENSSVPTYELLNRIAGAEDVDTEWLITGDTSIKVPARLYENTLTRGEIISELLHSFEALSTHELNSLRWFFKRKGIEAMLYLLNESDFKLLQLPDEEKERLMALHEAKKGAPEDSQENELTRPTHKAG